MAPAAAGAGGSGGSASAGCPPRWRAPDGGAAFPDRRADPAIATYKTLVNRTYQLSVDEAKKLQTAIAAFVAAPDAAKLTAASTPGWRAVALQPDRRLPLLRRSDRQRG